MSTSFPDNLPRYLPPGESLDIIYSDSYLLVVNKPPGLLTVPGRGADKQDCLSSRLQKDFSDALIVHRLDMATSGLVLFARGIEIQRQLSLMFREHKISKSYIAIVSGKLELEAGEVNLPIIADWTNRPKQKIDHELGKSSLTYYRTLHASDSCSRVELQPVTGRTHQLRVHMSAIAHPILGDALYGEVSSAPRLMLHAATLRFKHPVGEQVLELVSNPAF